MTFHFFAYGSFSKGQIHFPKFSNFIVDQQKAFARGLVYRLQSGFPGFFPDQNGELVEGMGYQLEVPETFWPVLDQCLGVDFMKQEKCLFNRSQISLQVENHSTLQAFVYSLNPKKITKKMSPIPQGNWQKSLMSQPPVVSRLEPRHKNYISKLSQCRGRDIVPIKLDLYQELINLDLIVDKGRRLALTPLGKEASLFLS